MGYHISKIKRGVYGELSKVQEELDEAIDAEKQGCKLMLLLELSDMIGAIEVIATKNGHTLEDLITMNKITKRAFMSGERESKL